MHKKFKKWSTKMIIIEAILSLFFWSLIILWIHEIHLCYKDWSYVLLGWLIVLWIIELLLFIQSIIVLKRNLKLWKARKEQKENMKNLIYNPNKKFKKRKTKKK